MFDIGMSEMAVVGVVALIVVGPKDLPMMFRKVGQFVGKARGMARDFSRAMNDAADSAGVKDVTDTLKSASDMSTKGLKDVAKGLADYDVTPSKDGLSAVEAANEAAEKWPPEDIFAAADGADDDLEDVAATVTKAADSKTPDSKTPEPTPAEPAEAKT